MNLIDQDCLPETLAFNASFEAAAASRPSRTYRLDAATLVTQRRNRLGSDAPPVRLAQGQDRTLPSGVVVRVFVPDTVEGVYLHIHGGGWALGSADGQDEKLWRLAVEARLAVVSVDYRLAPEHALTDCADDCEAAARWLVENAEAEFGPDRLLIGGESAGAHLSVVTLLRLRDKHDLTGAFRAANLVYGVYDLGMTPSQRLFGSRALLSNSDSMRSMYETVLPGVGAEERRDPALSPLYADLTGMPPARLVVGTEDPLRDDTLFLAARWEAPVRLDVVAGAMHGFTLFPLTVTEREAQRQAEFLAKA